MSKIYSETLEAVLEQLNVDDINDLSKEDREQVEQFCEELTDDHWNNFGERFYDELGDLKSVVVDPEEDEI